MMLLRPARLLCRVGAPVAMAAKARVHSHAASSQIIIIIFTLRRRRLAIKVVRVASKSRASSAFDLD